MSEVNLLITGATGFLGKVVLEEILRKDEKLSLGKIYLLIRPRKDLSPLERFEHKIWSSPCLSEIAEHKKDYIQVVSGDGTKEQLGLSLADQQAMQSCLTHIINCSASINFDDPLEKIARDNIFSTLELNRFALGCSRLKVFSHVSTAYVNHPSSHGEELPEELVPLDRPAKDIYQDILDAKVSFSDVHNNYPNTYTLTKCISEHLLTAATKEAPFRLNILRPSIIANSLYNPFPGWTDSYAGYLGFVYLIGGGIVKGCCVNDTVKGNIVPVDLVSHAIVEETFSSSDKKEQIFHLTIHPEDQPLYIKLVDKIVNYFQHNPIIRMPGKMYTKKGIRYQMVHHILERFPLLAQKAYYRFLLRNSKKADFIDNTIEHVAGVHNTFHYFTHNSWNFVSSLSYHKKDLETYFERIVFQGSLQYLFKKDLQELSIAGRKCEVRERDLRWVFKRKRANLVTRIMAYILRKVFRRCFAHVKVDINSFPQYKSEHPYVIIPTHRSYFDFLLCCYVFYDRPDLDIKLPYIAGTEDFFKIPLIGWLFKHAKCFPIRRNVGREDPELTETVKKLVDRGENLKFYIEGTRSRTRQFLRPKKGLLRCLQNTGKSFSILPVSISYERIAEEEVFYEEILSGRKRKMSLRSLGKWCLKLIFGKIDLGSVHIKAGEIIPLIPESNIEDTVDRIMLQLQVNKVATEYHDVPVTHLDDHLPLKTSEVNGDGDKHILQQWCHQNQWIFRLFPLLKKKNPWIDAYIQQFGYLPEDTLQINSEEEAQQAEQSLIHYFGPLLNDCSKVCGYVLTVSEFTRQDILDNCQPRLGSISTDFTISFLLEQEVLSKKTKDSFQRIAEIDSDLLGHLEELMASSKILA